MGSSSVGWEFSNWWLGLVYEDIPGRGINVSRSPEVWKLEDNLRNNRKSISFCQVFAECLLYGRFMPCIQCWGIRHSLYIQLTIPTGALDFEWESSPGYTRLDLNIIFLGAFFLKQQQQLASFHNNSSFIIQCNNLYLIICNALGFNYLSNLYEYSYFFFMGTFFFMQPVLHRSRWNLLADIWASYVH